MELIAIDFYFYPNGTYKNVCKWDSQHYAFNNDIQEVSTAIRVSGTEEQTDKALDDFIEKTGLNLDEAYDLKVEAKGSFHYNEANNIKVAKKLEQYNELYIQQNNKALIFNLRQ